MLTRDLFSYLGLLLCYAGLTSPSMPPVQYRQLNNLILGQRARDFGYVSKDEIDCFIDCMLTFKTFKLCLPLRFIYFYYVFIY